MESLSNSFKELGLLLFTVPTYAALILLELYFSNLQERDKPLYSWRDSLTNLYLTLSQMVVDVATRWIPTYLAFEFCYRYRFISWENPIWYWFWLLVLQDFCFYWVHRTEHSSRFFWAVHATHHSSEHFNLSVGFRSSVLEPIYRFVFYLPLPFLGFQAKDIMLSFAVTQIYGLLVHTQYIRRIPIYEWVFVTPSHHRVHHALNVRYLDKNMGMWLIIWDKLFGTFQEELTDDKPVYGLVGGSEKNLRGPVNVIFHEFKDIWKDFFVTYRNLPLCVRLKYVFAPPGWSHDGSRKTSQQLRQEAGMATPQNDGLEHAYSISKSC
jgi:sterol desaturase/sphingolipid hydroxylase (fatty acid hydroxylase superfamily)